MLSVIRILWSLGARRNGRVFRNHFGVDDDLSFPEP
jgi:hypothetical protein